MRKDVESLSHGMRFSVIRDEEVVSSDGEPRLRGTGNRVGERPWCFDHVASERWTLCARERWTLGG